MTLNYHIHPRRAALVLGGIALCLTTVSFTADYLLFFVLDLNVESDLLASFLDILSVMVEASIPTWYAVVLLAIAAVLLSQISYAKYKQKAPFTLYWIGLTLIFTYLSLDESAVIHEAFSQPIETTFNTSGLLNFGWLVVFFPLLIIFGLLYLRFLWHLPPPFKRLLVLSGMLYVGGAVVIEALSASQYVDGETFTRPYIILATIEECCEMLGVVLFIYSLLRYMQALGYEFIIRPAPVPVEQTASPSPIIATAQAPEGATSGYVYPLIAIIVFLLFTNGALLLNAVSVADHTEGQILTDRPLSVIFRERFAASDVLVVELEGIFGLENPPAQQMTAALLSNYQRVIVVALPQDDQSIAFAGDVLPFDQNTLSELLRAEGFFEYLVFDTPMVLTIASAGFSIISP